MQEIGNWSALGRHFGVSDNAVRKWAKRFGLDLSLCNGRYKPTKTTTPVA
jgi:transposase-like protein